MYVPGRRLIDPASTSRSGVTLVQPVLGNAGSPGGIGQVGKPVQVPAVSGETEISLRRGRPAMTSGVSIGVHAVEQIVFVRLKVGVRAPISTASRLQAETVTRPTPQTEAGLPGLDGSGIPVRLISVWIAPIGTRSTTPIATGALPSGTGGTTPREEVLITKPTASTVTVSGPTGAAATSVGPPAADPWLAHTPVAFEQTVIAAAVQTMSLPVIEL